MRALIQDLRYSFRSLTRKPLFACGATLMLAIGLGSAAAVFTLLDALLLRPLDIRDPERLVRLTNRRTDAGSLPLSYPMWLALRERQQSFESMFAWAYPALTIELDGKLGRVAGLLASGEMFETLGVGAAIGRTLNADDDKFSRPVAVLSHDFWRRRFGADPGVIGKAIRLEWQLYTIVGVAAKGFAGLQPGVPCELILPVSNMASLRRGPDWHAPSLLWLEVHGRLNRDVSVGQARAELRTLWPGILEVTIPPRASPERERLFRSQMIEVESGARGSSRYQDLFADPIYVLGAVVSLLLLIICVNITNLMLAHASSKRRESAIRLAIGAGRVRVFRQAAFESLWLTAGGAVLGLAFSVAASRALAALWDSGPGRVALDLRVDVRLFAFLSFATVIVALLAGLGPAVRVAWQSPVTAIKEGAASLVGSRSRLGAALLAVQVAVSLSLLSGANLLTRSLANLRDQPIDFRQDGILLMSLSPIMGSYGERDIDAYYAELLENVRAIPGVESAALADHFPTGIWPSPFVVKGPPDRATDEVTTTASCVSPGVFETLGTPLLAGRAFEPQDNAGSSKVAIINETLARALFGVGNPIGQWIGFGLEPNVRDKRVVGVIRDLGYRGFRQAQTAAVYTPCAQRGGDGYLTLVVRSAGPPSSVAGALEDRIQTLGVEIPVRVTTLREQAEQTLVRERALASLSGVIAAFALVLVAFGLYAVVSSTLHTQTREIGVRMALGADRSRVLRWVMRRALWMTIAGLAVGLPVAVYTGKYVESLLFGISPTNLLTLSGAAALLVIVSLGAAVLPARRAASIEPMNALRKE